MFNPPNKKITNQDEQTIVRLYLEGKSALQILQILDRKFKTTKTIYDVLKKFQISSRETSYYNSVDHYYFSDIDNSKKAYVLGWMLSDGWVQSKRNQIGIQLSIKDTSIIEMIRSEWKTNNKIIYIKPKVIVSSKKNYTSQPLHRIMVHSKKMIEDLGKYNIVDKKSLTLTLPILNNYMPDMIRGIFDGDGCAYFHSQTEKPVLRFNGSNYMMAQISLFLHLSVNISLAKPQEKGNISSIEWYKAQDIQTLKKYLYTNLQPGYFLERKYEYFKNI